MIVFKTAAALQQYLNRQRSNNRSIGFVPTMGALHEGHISLVQECKAGCNITVCSIFVNPTQFNDKADFEQYPVTIEADIYLLESHQADVLFLPSVNEIYPEGLQHLQHFNIGYLETILEGAHRPGHFQGVCNVVARLLKTVCPDVLFLGRKDFQQYLVLKTMMQQAFPQVTINLVDIKREPGGLALSSRNMRLSEAARRQAVGIYNALQFISNNKHTFTPQQLRQQAQAQIAESGFEKIDYVEICDMETLLPVNSLQEREKYIALAAAFINNVRLIDNVVL